MRAPASGHGHCRPSQLDQENAMADSKDRNDDPRTDREVSRRVARENADAAADTRRSNQPGVDDDSDIVRSLVGTLGAPVEGGLDSMEERERFAAHGEDLGPDQVGGVSGQREQDVPHYDRERPAKVPTKPSDAEADPKDVAEDMSRDRPGATGRR
jgi:hypothetical protein